uniref:MARVEL domain-containing protein n=1 Tax=Strongyloides stercoralis TaxID=6248 RepID=A0AAF5D3J4_STRER
MFHERKEGIVEGFDYNPNFEESLQYFENETLQSSSLKKINDRYKFTETIDKKVFTEKVCDSNEKIPYIDENDEINFEAYDLSLVVSGKTSGKHLDSYYEDEKIKNCLKKKDGNNKKVHFEKDISEYDNLKENFGWWLNRKENRRKSYEQMIPLNNTTSKYNSKEDVKQEINGQYFITNKHLMCLKILKYFFLFLLFLIPLFLFGLAFFGFGLCDITPTIPQSLYFIGFLILSSFFLSILLSLDWSPAIAIFLTIILTIIYINLIGISIFGKF